MTLFLFEFTLIGLKVFSIEFNFLFSVTNGVLSKTNGELEFVKLK